MKNNRSLIPVGRYHLAVGAVIVSLLAGYTGYADGLHAGITVDVNPHVVVPDVFAPQDDYVYYPAYGVYYSNNRHLYAYQDHGRWMSRATPPSVSVDVLHSSPSVKMDFHDSPAHHHADIVKRYPKNWSSGHADHGGKEDHR